MSRVHRQIIEIAGLYRYGSTRRFGAVTTNGIELFGLPPRRLRALLQHLGSRYFLAGNLRVALSLGRLRFGIVLQRAGGPLYSDQRFQPGTSLAGRVASDVHPDEIRYRFGAHLVVLRRITDDNVGVEINGRPAEQLP